MSFISSFDGLLWLLCVLLPFIFVQRSVHREIQSFLLLLTRNSTVALTIFSILFFPGVLLHELSHFIAARLLSVQTGKFSLIPHTASNGQVVLGYVETARTGMLRDSIIGAAPLLTGCTLVSLIAVHKLQLTLLTELLQNGQFELLGNALISLPASMDFWLWFYLAFVISSTMMPSSLDRRAWLPLGISFAILLGITLIVGAGSWMLEVLANPFNSALKALALAFTSSLVLHVFLWPPFYLLRKILSRLTGLTVSY